MNGQAPAPPASSATRQDAAPRGMAAWLLQRVSGIFLVYALAVHLWTVHVVDNGRLDWATLTARLQDDTLWTVYYTLFVPAVVYHAANGLWGIVLDYNPPAGARRVGLALCWAAGLGLVGYGYIGLRPLLG